MKKIIDCLKKKIVFIFTISFILLIFSLFHTENTIIVLSYVLNFINGVYLESNLLFTTSFMFFATSLFFLTRKVKNKILNLKLDNYLSVSLIISVTFIISVIFQWYRLKAWDQRGTFGDSFGAINALFAFLTFIGLIYTINKEKERFIEQQTIERNYFIEQKRTEHFFKLLDIFIQLPIRNTDFFRTFTNNIKNSSSKSKKTDIEKEIETLSKNAINSDILYGGNNNISFVVYMNTIESLISYIEQKTDEEELKKDFYKTLQSQFLENEAFFLVIYSLVYEKDSIKSLFEEALKDRNNLYYKYFKSNALLEIIESIKK